MTTDDPVVSALSRTNPEPAPVPGPGAEALLARIVAEAAADPAPATARTPRHPARVLVPLTSVAVVLAVIAVLVAVGSPPTARAPGSAGERIVYRASPTPLAPHVTPATLRREVTVLRAHARSAGLPVERVALAGHDEIAVTFSPGSDVAQDERIFASLPQLEIDDWEANLIAPNGQTVASGLRAQRDTAIALSQGGARGPGVARAGGMPLYAAVRLAARRRPAPANKTLSRLGPQYYLFRDAGSASCPGATPCYLAGPVAPRSALPGGGTAPRTRVLAVPQGTLVVQAASQTVSSTSPRARFYVLRDRIAVNGALLTDPTVTRAAVGGDEVDLRTAGLAQRQFRELTATLAHRGQRVSLTTEEFNQHFAIVLDGRLLGVPQINFKQFPDGVLSGRSIGIVGGLSPRGARTLAAQLQVADAPLALQRISPKG
jgi:SecD/SecF fusion protein